MQTITHHEVIGEFQSLRSHRVSFSIVVIPHSFRMIVRYLLSVVRLNVSPDFDAEKV